MQYQHFSVEEREAIQEGLWRNDSLRSIARRLGRSHSSIVRELRRNWPPLMHRYTPRLAHDRAMRKRRSRGRTERLKSGLVRQYVIGHLKRRWSPEQIAGRIRVDLGISVSHEAIYQFIYAQIRHGLVVRGGEDLRAYLRRRRRLRQPHGVRRFQRITRPFGPSIDDRPSVVALRSRIGDWEGDTVESRNHRPGLNTLVERKTGLVFMTKLRDRTAQATVAAVQSRLTAIPEGRKRTLTLDRGTENTGWAAIEAATGLRCFFAHAYHSWERGTNENTNGLIRDFFPKRTDFTLVPEALIAEVEFALNTRPRKRLGWQTPLEVWGGALHG